MPVDEISALDRTQVLMITREKAISDLRYKERPSPCQPNLVDRHISTKVPPLKDCFDSGERGFSRTVFLVKVEILIPISVQA